MIWNRLFPARGTRAHSARPDRRTPTLRVELLEDRSVPAAAAASAFTFTPNSFGGGNFNPFPGFTGQVETTSGDVNGDGVADIIAAEGPGTGSTGEVRVFDGAAARNGQAVLIADFYPYSNVAGAGQTSAFAGGVYVAAADLTDNPDGIDQLVTSTGTGGQGNVKVFDFQGPNGQFLGSDPTLLSSFDVYPGYLGQVPIAAVSTGAGQAALVTASGAGTTSSDVRVFTDAATLGQVPVGTVIPPAAQTIAYPGFLGGVALAAGGSGTNPQLYLETGTGVPVLSSFNLNATATGGLVLAQGDTFQTGTVPEANNFLASADINDTGTLDLLTSSYGSGVSTPVTAYSLASGTAQTLTLPAGFQTFQGFGYFGNGFLAASAFTSPSLSTGTTALGTTALGTAGTAGTGTTAATTDTGVGSTTISPALNNGVTTGVGTGTNINAGLGGTASTTTQTSLAATGPTTTTAILNPAV